MARQEIGELCEAGWQHHNLGRKAWGAMLGHVGSTLGWGWASLDHFVKYCPHTHVCTPQLLQVCLHPKAADRLCKLSLLEALMPDALFVGSGAAVQCCGPPKVDPDMLNTSSSSSEQQQ